MKLSNNGSVWFLYTLLQEISLLKGMLVISVVLVCLELLTFIVPESKRLNYQVAFRSVRTNTEQTLQKNSVRQPRVFCLPQMMKANLGFLWFFSRLYFLAEFNVCIGFTKLTGCLGFDVNFANIYWQFTSSVIIIMIIISSTFRRPGASTFNKSARSSIHTAASDYGLYFIVRNIIIITVCVRLAYCYKTATFMAAGLKLIRRLRGLLLALSALETNSTVSHHWRSFGSLSLLTVDSKSCCVGIACLLFSCQKLLQRLAALFLLCSCCSRHSMITTFSAILGDHELMYTGLLITD